MKFSKNKFFSCCRRTKADGKAVMAGIAIVFFAGILSRLLSGSPLRMLHLTGLFGAVPPIWFYTLIWSIWYIILGFCFGFTIGCKTIGREIHKYKGSLWFVIMLIFNIIWYPLFFKAGTVFLALVDAVLILVFAVFCGIEYYKVNKFIGFLIFAHILWLLWCFLINLKAFLSI